MEKKRFIGYSIFFVLGLVLVFFGWKFFQPNSIETHCEKRANCPNIVLVILDDMPWSHFGFLSDTRSVTPHLDDMAREGFVFRNVYNTNSRCRASLATYLTGQLPHQNLIYSNQGVLKLHDDKILIRLLSEAGYATFAGGKLWEGNPEQLNLTEHDLDTFHFVRTSQDKLTAFLDRYARKKPLFVWWAPLLPHKNHNAPERYFQGIDPATIAIPDSVPDKDKNAYRQAEHAFLATIAWVDDEIGGLRTSLTEHGLDKNTWIIVLSDNGWSNLYPAKGSAYDIGVRTPMIVMGPGVEHGSTERLVSTQNLYDSLLSLAGISVESNRKAASNVFSLINTPEKNSALPGENTVHWASYPSYTGKSEPYPRAGRDVYALSLRQDNWQYTFYIKSFDATGSDDEKAPAIIHTGLNHNFNYQMGDEELFELSTDPFSKNNLAKDHERHSLVLAFRKSVFEWWDKTGGKEIDGIENCKTVPGEMCKKYYQVYPELLL